MKDKGDLISREALKKAITKHCRSETECLNHFWYDENIIALIDNAPTVELDESVIQEVLNKRCMTAVTNEYLIALHGKRPQGKWIYTPNIIGLSEYEGITCSICGDDSIGDFNYCPNCGAKMVKGGAE